MQAIEAYLAKKIYNKDVKLSKSCKNAIKEIKEKYSEVADLQTINERIFNGISLKQKICNAINEEKLENIIKFKLHDKDKYSLVADMGDLRNYYTHYGDNNKIDNINIRQIIEYTKILCELFILKELMLDDKQIKTSLSNNYYQLGKWDNKYCRLEKTNPQNGYSRKNYLGDFDGFDKDKNYTNFALYCIPLDESKIKLVAKSRMKNSRALSIVIDKDVSENELNKLEIYFRVCFERYKDEQNQRSYRQIT